MPTARNNIGRDARVIVITEDGVELRMNTTMFTSQEKTTAIETQPLDDYLTTTDLPQGWSGSFEVDRDNRAIDDYFAQRAARFFAGGSIRNGTIYSYITETDGSTSSWEFGRTSLRYTAGGQFKGDEKVTQTIEFSASWKRPV